MKLTFYFFYNKINLYTMISMTFIPCDARNANEMKWNVYKE